MLPGPGLVNLTAIVVRQPFAGKSGAPERYYRNAPRRIAVSIVAARCRSLSSWAIWRRSGVNQAALTMGTFGGVYIAGGRPALRNF
ncbi:glucokinase [Salmonella enterica subsp. enterica serovar Weltevreden]|nr:glucokinase [Salmonella enterica subsp. enterica serovar Weltevreden]